MGHEGVSDPENPIMQQSWGAESRSDQFDLIHLGMDRVGLDQFDLVFLELSDDLEVDTGPCLEIRDLGIDPVQEHDVPGILGDGEESGDHLLLRIRIGLGLYTAKI